MQEQDGNKGFNISERLEDLRREHEALRWEGTFRDYFELVAQNASRNSRTRVSTTWFTPLA
jgi:hypothetical protein